MITPILASIDFNSIINFVVPYIPTILKYSFILLCGGGAGAWLTRKKLFVRNLGEAAIALSDLMDGASDEEVETFVTKVKDLVAASKQ